MPGGVPGPDILSGMSRSPTQHSVCGDQCALVVKDKVIMGSAGASTQPQLHCACDTKRPAKKLVAISYDSRTRGPGNETWLGDSWKRGGALEFWVTRYSDPELNLTYWGIGDPGPDLESREQQYRRTDAHSD